MLNIAEDDTEINIFFFSSGQLAVFSSYKVKIFVTLSSSTLAMLLLSMRSFSMEMGSLLPRTSWISSRVR